MQSIGRHQTPIPLGRPKSIRASTARPKPKAARRRRRRQRRTRPSLAEEGDPADQVTALKGQYAAGEAARREEGRAPVLLPSNRFCQRGQIRQAGDGDHSQGEVST